MKLLHFLKISYYHFIFKQLKQRLSVLKLHISHNLEKLIPAPTTGTPSKFFSTPPPKKA